MKILRHVILLLVMVGIGAGAAYAFFSAQAKVQGVSFSTGTAVLKIAKTNTAETDWTKDTLTGDIFDGIIPGWTNNYHVFVKNTGTTVLQLTLSGNLSGTDACGLSSDIKLSLGTFDDTLTALGALSGGIDLGELNPNDVKDVTLSFRMPVDTILTGETTCTITSYNFVFDGATAIPTIQPTQTPTPTPI